MPAPFSSFAVTIVLRHYLTRNVYDWWVLNELGFPLACGQSRKRRAAFLQAKAMADQCGAERAELKRAYRRLSNPLTRDD
jgi:hypothetical protein